MQLSIHEWNKHNNYIYHQNAESYYFSQHTQCSTIYWRTQYVSIFKFHLSYIAFKNHTHTRIYIVMPMEIFVSCVGDLGTVGGSVLVMTLVHSPPASFSFFVCEALGIRKFYPGSSFVFWPSWVPVGSWCEQDALYLDTCSAGACSVHNILTCWCVFFKFIFISCYPSSDTDSTKAHA